MSAMRLLLLVALVQMAEGVGWPMFGALLVMPAGANSHLISFDQISTTTLDDKRSFDKWMSAGAAFGVVRCCDRNQSCHSVCSSSPSDDLHSASKSSLATRTCIDSSAATWAEAAAECVAHRLQLCPSTVVEGGGCCQSGCRYESYLHGVIPTWSYCGPESYLQYDS